MDNEQILESLSNDGYFIFRNWFSNESSKLLLEEISDAHSLVNVKSCGTFDNPHTKTVRSGGHFSQGTDIIIRPVAYRHFPALLSVISNKSLNDIVDSYYGSNSQKFMQTFSTHEKHSVDDDLLGRHSWLHVDPYQSLKFAFFPLGTTKESGCLRVIPQSNKEGRTIREQFMSKNPKGLNGGIAHRMVDFKNYCPDLVTRSEDEVIYIECSHLDLVAIDTDTYHAGGAIEKDGLERLAVYIHNRR
jgi:hypothetical protein